MSSPATSPKKSLMWWALAQLGLFVQGIFTLLLGGLLRSMIQRTFAWKAFVLGVGVVAVGLGAVFLVVFSGHDSLRGWPENLLWTGSLGVMGVAGAVVGRAAKRVGVWESYLVFLVTAAVLGLHLAKGWHVLLSFGASDTQSAFDFVASVAPGERLFGPMWDRVFALAALGSLLMMVLGGSIAYLVFGEEGRFDPGWRYEWVVARKHLAGRKGWVSVTAVVAVLGVAVGVAALVSVTAVMSGYQNDVQEKILSTNAHLVVRKYGIDFEEYDKIAQLGMTVPGVLASTPFSFNEAMLSDGDLGMGVLIKGIVPQTAGQVTSIHENLCRSVSLQEPICVRFGSAGSGEALAERLQPRDGLPSAVIGTELFKKLGLPIGGAITLTTPVGIAGARGNAPRRMQFRIGGVFSSGMHEFDSRLIYLHLSAAQSLMGMGTSVNGVEFRVAEPENVEIYAKKILSAVGRYPYSTLDWRELNIGIFTALKLQKIVMFLVLCSIILVGAFNIASTLFMAVVEKSREIGVLKSIGARNASIMKIFVLEGWMVGLFGTVIGVVLGLMVCVLLERLDIGIAADVYMVNSLEVRIDALEVVGTALAALAISHLATVYPALRAARQAPVDAMRYD